MLKVLLLVCLVPLVMGSREEMMEMFNKMMEMKKKGEGMGGRSGEMGGRSGEMGDDRGGDKHYEGDSDGCQSKEEAMMKKFMMYKKFNEMEKYKEMMKKKMEMKEKMEKMEAFKKFMEAEEKKKMWEAMEQKKKMYDMWQKYEAMKMKKEKENEFKELIESFTEQKHKFAFKLTHHFLTLCKCGEVSAQMSKMFMDRSMANSSSFTDDMAEENLMEAYAAGNMAEVAAQLKKMSPEKQKKMYMAGLIKSMCGGAKSYVMAAKKFEEQYMQANNGMTTQTAAPNVTVSLTATP